MNKLLKKFLKVLGLSNSNKIIYELVGNPGSGKTTLLKNYHAKFQIQSENEKFNYRKRSKYELAKFILLNPFILIYTSFWMLVIAKSFMHLHLKYNFKRYLKRYFKIYKILLISWFILKKNKSKFIFIESIFHQISNLEIGKENLINAIVASYGFPKFGIILIDIPIEDSMNRQLLRKDNINIHNPDTIERYKNSYLIFKQIFSFFKYKFEKSKLFLKPFYIRGKDSINLNVNKLDEIKNSYTDQS